MTVVEGHTVTMVCQASGKAFSSRSCSHLGYFPCHLLCYVFFSFPPSRLPSSCHHLVQTPGPVAVETHGEQRSLDADWRGAAGFRTVHLQRHQRARLQRSLHTDGGGEWVSGLDTVTKTRILLPITSKTSVVNLHAGPPYATSLPDQVKLRPRDSLSLQCLAHGSPPITFEWSRVGHAGLPAGTETTRSGKLMIAQVRTSDSGTYKCVASNHIGSSEALAKVVIRGESIVVLLAGL